MAAAQTNPNHYVRSLVPYASHKVFWKHPLLAIVHVPLEDCINNNIIIN